MSRVIIKDCIDYDFDLLKKSDKDWNRGFRWVGEIRILWYESIVEDQLDWS